MRKPQLIPFSDLNYEVIDIATKWIDGYSSLGESLAEQRHKLASDIMNYSELTAPAKVTRVEVITDKGRQLVDFHKDNKVELSYQDEGRTLKIFITRK